MPAYYDYLLGGIPATFLGGAGLTILTGGTLQIGMGLGGFLAIALIAHGLFIRAPTTRATIETVPKDEQPKQTPTHPTDVPDGTQTTASQTLSSPIDS